MALEFKMLIFSIIYPNMIVIHKSKAKPRSDRYVYTYLDQEYIIERRASNYCMVHQKSTRKVFLVLLVNHVGDN